MGATRKIKERLKELKDYECTEAWESDGILIKIYTKHWLYKGKKYFAHISTCPQQDSWVVSVGLTAYNQERFIYRGHNRKQATEETKVWLEKE